MGTYTSWKNYITGIPITNQMLWDAFQQLDLELDRVYDAANVHFVSVAFPSYTTVHAALEAALGNTGPGVNQQLSIPSPNVDPLIDGTVYARWIMSADGTFSSADFYVDTAPTGDCTLEIRKNTVQIALITIPSGTNKPAAITDLSSTEYEDRDVIDVRCVTANTAGQLAGYVGI